MNESGHGEASSFPTFFTFIILLVHNRGKMGKK